MALGAVASDIRRMIVRQTAVLVIIGVAIGLAGGALIARASASVLFRVSPSDPVTYGGVAVLLGLVALFAAYFPVRRAVSVDPRWRSATSRLSAALLRAGSVVSERPALDAGEDCVSARL